MACLFVLTLKLHKSLTQPQKTLTILNVLLVSQISNFLQYFLLNGHE